MEDEPQIATAVQTAQAFEAECCDCGMIFIRDGSARPWAARRCDPCRESDEAEAAEEQRRKRYADSWPYYEQTDELGSRLARVEYVVARHNQAARETAMNWLALSRHERPNLIIHGPIGCGKSTLAGLVYRELHRDFVLAWWQSAPSLIAQVKAGFADREAARDAAERFGRAGRVEVLVLDDLGKVHPGRDGVSWLESQFFTIVDARYRDELPTIVTTEYTGTALARRVGPSVVDRLIDGAMVAGIKKPTTPYRRPRS